jgi:U6 snRNA-associated Sm-like protein LSm7
VTGNLKGYDQLLNLVLDDTLEYLRGAPARSLLHARIRALTLLALTDPDDPLRVTDATRSLGLVVLRGTAVMVVAPTDGTEEIANPFAAEGAEASE